MYVPAFFARSTGNIYLPAPLPIFAKHGTVTNSNTHRLSPKPNHLSSFCALLHLRAEYPRLTSVSDSSSSGFPCLSWKQVYSLQSQYPKDSDLLSRVLDRYWIFLEVTWWAGCAVSGNYHGILFSKPFQVYFSLQDVALVPGSWQKQSELPALALEVWERN